MTSKKEMCCLGKLPARRDARTLTMAKYLRTEGLPVAPPALAFTSKVAHWPMMDNDKIGDCTVAAAGHMIQEWTAYTEKLFTPATEEIVRAYSAVSGYDPETGRKDRGAAALDVLNHWRQIGIAGHKIEAYVGLEPKNHMHIQDSVYLFGNVYLGLALPKSAKNQTAWSVPPYGPVGDGAPGSWDGHMVPVVGYDARGLTVVTWGELLRMSWSFLDTYSDEAYAVLSEDWITKTKRVTVKNFHMATLRRDLEEVAKEGRKEAA